MKVCAYRNCFDEFEPKTHRQKYCCQQHAKAEAGRKYRDDPSVRDRLAQTKRQLRAKELGISVGAPRARRADSSSRESKVTPVLVNNPVTALESRLATIARLAEQMCKKSSK